jgi:hypothetical protein
MIPSEPTPSKLFERWIIAPLEELREIPNSDGAFAALGIAFGLYERYVKSCLQKSGSKEGPDEFRAFGANDLSVDREVFGRFWEMYRDGIQHSMQPKRYTSKGIRWGWEISEAHSSTPRIVEKDKDLRIVCIEPWGFIGEVLDRYKKSPELIDFKDSWKFGKIAATARSEITWSAPPSNSSEEKPKPADLSTGIFPGLT